MSNNVKTIDDYMDTLKQIHEYKEELQEIRKKYEFDKKEDFISKGIEEIKTVDFLNNFINEIYYIGKTCKKAGYKNKYWDIFRKYGIEIDEETITSYKFCIEDDNLFIYYIDLEFNDEINVMCIHLDVDFYLLLDDLNKLSHESLERIEEKERLKKEKIEKEEYELYLKLKEKYEK